ncbi:MAG: AbrB/MazE/SpoVT family DNA-binding domain-containing protein [Candidatus Methanomethylophilaceae archaeon]|nr:AbrB/MazE/SpoVT family DNA-binding domain-containing protein [Candidatus Methanomethylophilaceae archaeon]
MRAENIIMTYRGYDIVETDTSTENPSGDVVPILIIPGLKEGLTRPILASIRQAEDYIDGELEARERRIASAGAEFSARVRTLGHAVGITIPAEIRRKHGINVGDELTIIVKKSDSGPGA